MREFSRIKNIQGELSFSGDKSISHRALILSSLNKKQSKIKNLSLGADVKSTILCLKEMGIYIELTSEHVLVSGMNMLPNRHIKLNAGNSGTTARLLSGLLIHQRYGSTIVGDSSLSSRPMTRIIKPLTLMGGDIKSTGNGTLPLKITPSNELHPIEYKMDVPSAQVKSAVLLSGLNMEGKTILLEEHITRDHTERMLGLEIEVEKSLRKIIVDNSKLPLPGEYFIPGDISSAAFFIVLALLLEKSSLVIRNISFNPTRTAILEVLKKMGGNINYSPDKTSYNEPYGDLAVKFSSLKNIEISSDLIPQLIDEIPLLAVAGVFAEGIFTIRNAEELRYKESDRIKAICQNFRIAGLEVEEYQDGFSISGSPGDGGYTFESFGDHRIAMAFAIFSSLLLKGGKVNNFESVGISNPDFLKQLNSIVK